MKIDIICPLYNAQNDLEFLNESFKKQKNVEIDKIRYVLTDSTDKSEKILDEIVKKQDNIVVTKIRKDEFSHSLTREEAAFESKADIVVFVTQDVKIKDDNWLYELTKDIGKDNIVACYSRQLCDYNNIEKYTRESNYPDKDKIVSEEDVEELGLKAFFFSDASSAIDRKTFVELNGYDQKKLIISEDMYIAYKIITSGYKIKYCSKSLVHHSHDFTLKQYYDRYYDTGKFFKENDYLNQYKVNQAGGSLAMYILKRAIQDKNFKVLIKFIPNMGVRFIGMKMGKLNG